MSGEMNSHKSMRKPPRCFSAPNILVNSSNSAGIKTDIPELISNFTALRSPRHCEDQDNKHVNPRASSPQAPAASKKSAVAITCGDDVSDCIGQRHSSGDNNNINTKRRKAGFRKPKLKLDLNLVSQHADSIPEAVHLSTGGTTYLHTSSTQRSSVQRIQSPAHSGQNRNIAGAFDNESLSEISSSPGVELLKQPQLTHGSSGERAEVMNCNRNMCSSAPPTPRNPPKLLIPLDSETQSEQVEVLELQTQAPPERWRPPPLGCIKSMEEQNMALSGSTSEQEIRRNLIIQAKERNFPMNEWERKQRDIAYGKILSEIEPHLFIGSVEGAKDEAQRRKYNITAMLDCAKSSQGRRTHHEHHVRMVSDMEHGTGDLEYWSLCLHDRSGQDATSHFYNAIEIIEHVRKKGGVILIHCVKGISRSAAIVVAYLMWRHNWSFEESMQYVKAKRPTVNPNAGFVFQLYAWGTNRPKAKQDTRTSEEELATGTTSQQSSRSFVYKIEVSDTVISGSLQSTCCNLSSRASLERTNLELSQASEPCFMPLAVGPLVQISTSQLYVDDDLCYVVSPTSGASQYIWYNPERCSDVLVRAAFHVASQLSNFEGAMTNIEIAHCGKEPKEVWTLLNEATSCLNSDITVTPHAQELMGSRHCNPNTESRSMSEPRQRGDESSASQSRPSTADTEGERTTYLVESKFPGEEQEPQRGISHSGEGTSNRTKGLTCTVERYRTFCSSSPQSQFSSCSTESKSHDHTIFTIQDN